MGRIPGLFRTIGPIAKTALASLTAEETGVIEVGTDDIYIYLPTYVGNDGLTYTIKVLATYSAGVTVCPTLSQKVDGAASTVSTAIYDALTVVAGTDGWNITAKVGTWS